MCYLAEQTGAQNSCQLNMRRILIVCNYVHTILLYCYYTILMSLYLYNYTYICMFVSAYCIVFYKPPHPSLLERRYQSQRNHTAHICGCITSVLWGSDMCQTSVRQRNGYLLPCLFKIESCPLPKL